METEANLRLRLTTEERAVLDRIAKRDLHSANTAVRAWLRREAALMGITLIDAKPGRGPRRKKAA